MLAGIYESSILCDLTNIARFNCFEKRVELNQDQLSQERLKVSMKDPPTSSSSLLLPIFKNPTDKLVFTTGFEQIIDQIMNSQPAPVPATLGPSNVPELW